MISSPLRVLVVDDDEEDFLILRDLLVDYSLDEYRFNWAGTLQEGIAALHADEHDVFLVDYRLGPDSGLDLLRLAVAERRDHRPVIMLTGQGGPDVDREAMAIGASDYLVKGHIDAEQFARALRYAAERARQIAEIEEGKQRYRLLFEQGPIPAWVCDIATSRCMTVNDAMVASYGYDRDELLDMTIFDLQPPEEAERLREILETWRAGQAQAGVVWKHQRKDGSRLWAEITAHVLMFDGRPSWLIIANDITERREAEQRLLQLAHFDPLTALPNRTLFFESLKRAIEQAQENEWIVSVLFLDLDRFKNVNDTLGHAIGDELLRQAGHRLGESVRIRDTVARLGGDEFGIIMVDRDNRQIAGRIAGKLRKAIAQPFVLEGREVTVTASIGITSYPEDSTEIETLLRYADTAMYEAKDAGRDTHRFYSAEMNARSLSRLEMDIALRGALERDEFVLHYQPKICLGSGRWTGTEALLRWQRPDHGLVLPGEFIPALEDNGLINSVGNWAIDAACRQIVEWTRCGIRPAGVAVNVSVKQLLRGPVESDEPADVDMQPMTVAGSQELEVAVATAMREHAIGPGLLELELTESTLMLDAAKTVNLLHRLKASGTRISIDDFGTGYSSLAYLKRFPIDSVKIDQGFVRDITSNADDAAIAVAIMNVAHSLKLKVVAEGVETREQLEFLRDQGCDQAQGFYISRPMPADELASLFRSGPGPSHIFGQG